MTVLIANNVSSALAAPITAGATSMTVTDGSRFPVLTPGQYFYATIIATNGVVEIVKVITRTGNAMAITRAQDGTNAQAFPANARVEMRINAASVREIVSDQNIPLEARVTTAENDITALEGRMTTAEGDITTIEGDIVALEAFDTTLGTSAGSASVGFLQAGTSATARTVQAKLRDTVSVKDFGAVGDGVADDTAAIQAAIDSFSSGQGTICFPKGVYLVTSTISVTRDRVNLVGSGQWVTQIKFEPTSDDICIFIGKGGEGITDAGITVQCSVKGMTFFSSNTALKKTALELKDISQFSCEDVQIGSTTQWIGNGSIGIRTRGREGCSFKNIAIYTNRPFVFARNTSFPSISLDQFNFHNIFTVCRGHLQTPPVYDETNFFFEPGANFSNVSFSGYQSWNRGKNGMYYNNSSTAASGLSYNLSIENVRWEGTFGDDDTGHAFYFDHGTTSFADNISIKNCNVGEIGNGYYFRRCAGITLQNNSYVRNSGVALDITSSLGNEFLQVLNCFWQTGCTANIDAVFAAINAVRSDNTAPVFKTAIYTAAQGAGRRDMVAGAPINQTTIVVASADPTVVTLPLDATATVVGVFADSRGKFAIVGFNVVAKTTTLIYDDGTWSITQGTAAKLNVYWDAGSSTWKIENKTGVSRELYLQALGSNQ